MSDIYKIAYNLSAVEGLGWIPSAWAVRCNDKGEPAYADHKVYRQTIGDYGMENTEVRAMLFDLIDDLQSDQIMLKFNGKNKRKKPLEKLLADKLIKREIIRYIQKKIDIYLTTIVEHDFIFCLEFDRKDYIPTKLVTISHTPPEPELFFKRTDKGISYRLSFHDDKGSWAISSKNISVMVNNPAWVVIDMVLYKIPDINGNMVKPFFTKEELAIPKSYVKEYFQKFILRVVAKATISAEGFKVENPSAETECELEVNEDFMHKNYGISVYFKYSNNRFQHSSSVMQKTELNFNSEDDIVVYQHVRKLDEEAKFVEKLEKLGLVHDYGNFFKPKELMEESEEKKAQDPYDVHYWLVQNRAKFEKAGFILNTPQVGQKKITLSKPSIQLNLNQINDWFDIFGEFHVGKFSFPFAALADYIRAGNRFFPLPSGSFFIIPHEWMAKYASIFELGKVTEGSLRLAKSQYTVFDDFDAQSGLSGAPENLTQDFTNINYQQPAELKATLRPYQIDGIKWLIHLYHNNLGGCLADDMGLGKTLQTIAVLLYAKTQKKPIPEIAMSEMDGQGEIFSLDKKDDDDQPLQAMIIMPASLTYNWESEIKKFAPNLTVYKHIGNRRYRSKSRLIGYDVILTSYNTALKDIKLLSTLELEYLVLDESQQIKNKNSKIFEAVNSLTAEHKISLSGTPIENSLSDLWSQMQFINPELLGDFPFFKRNFITPIEKVNDEDKKEKLKRLVAPYLLRRTKEEVAKDLPDLTYKVLYTEMAAPQKKLYEKEKSAARNAILENADGDKPKSEVNIMILSTLLRLRQIANHPKLLNEKYNKGSGKFDEITHDLEMIRKGGYKVLIFSQFVTHLDLYQKWLEAEGLPFSKLIGSMPAGKRDREIKRFETKKDVQFFLISMKAGGTGLNLTAADYVFIADPWWNPSVEQQAIARAHRIGQQKNVIAIKYVAKDTIEEKILKLQERKQQLADDIINNNQKVKFNTEDLEYLLD